MSSGKTSDLLTRFSASRILRYAYPGFLLVAILLVLGSKPVSSMLSTAGPVLSVLIIFFAGAALYVIYRYVLGEFFLYNIHHCLHHFLDKTTGGTPSSPTGFLRSLGVPFFQRRAAYNSIRREFFSAELRERLDFAHSEIHLLWITAIELGGVALYLMSTDGSQHPVAFRLSGAVSLLALTAAIVADVLQSKVEFRTLKHAYPISEIQEFLQKLGFLTAPSQKVAVSPIHNKSDERGDSYYWPPEMLEFLGTVAEVHVSTVAPGMVRGNHYHEDRRELIFAAGHTAWTLAWRPRGANAAETRKFEGTDGILVSVVPEVPHAIRNEGPEPLLIVTASSGRYDPDDPDTFKEALIEPDTRANDEPKSSP